MKKFRVLTTGGGSGGHIYPIIAAVTELQLLCAQSNIEVEVRYVGACGDYKETLEENNIVVKRTISAKIRRYFSWLNFLEVPKFLFSFIQALWWVFWYMPDVLFSKGGTGSFPVVLAARFYMIPIVIHESDSIPGMSNQWGGKHAKVIAVSFPGVQKYFPNKKVVVIGNLIRRSLLQNINFNQEQVKRRLGFDDSKPLIFVYGGSQGAVRINNFILKNLPLILEVAQVYHQTGKNNYEDVLDAAASTLKELPEKFRVGYKAIDYLATEEEVQFGYIGADIVVSRAGASNIFEIAAFKRPSILIPLPESAQDHQRSNAYEYQSLGAGYVIEEQNLLPNIFINKLIDILSDRSKKEAMANAAANFYKPEAALNLAKILLEFRNG